MLIVVVGVLVVGGWFVARLGVLLGLLSFLASLVWGAIKVVGRGRPRRLVAWCVIRRPIADRAGGAADPGTQAGIDSKSSTCSATMRRVEK